MRLKVTLVELQPRDDKQALMKTRNTLEIEGEAKPALIAETLAMVVADRPHMGCFRSSSFFVPAAGVSPAKRGEAQRSRERSDLDTPAAGYTVARERALARSRRPLRSCRAHSF